MPLMKSAVRVGEIYMAKVYGRIVPIRVDSEVTLGLNKRYTGWQATNLMTGRHVIIRSALRLRWPEPGELEKFGVKP